MKKFFSLIVVLLFVFVAGNASAWDLGYTYATSDYDNHSGNVTTGANAFLAGGVLGSGSVTGNQWAGGEAMHWHDNVFIAPPGTNHIHGGATQNYGAALGGFNYNVMTGNKNFLWILPPVAGAIAGAEGDVSQWSCNHSDISGVWPWTGSAGSSATQKSGAGFEGCDADLLIGKNKSTSAGFSGESYVGGQTWSYSFKGYDCQKDTLFIGTTSGAANYANTTITGGGDGYAGGSGKTAGGSNLSGYNGSTSGKYSGQFSYCGNGQGNAVGYSTSYRIGLPYGAVFGTQVGITVNVPLQLQ